MIQIQVYLMVQTSINKKLFFKQDKVEKSMVKIADFAMFRNVFPWEMQGFAWAVGSGSIGQSAG